MKNPFERENHNIALIAGLAIGAVATGGLIYYYIKRNAEMKAAAEELKAHAKDYLKKKTKKFAKHKSDISDLADIVHHEG